MSKTTDNLLAQQEKENDIQGQIAQEMRKQWYDLKVDWAQSDLVAAALKYERLVGKSKYMSTLLKLVEASKKRSDKV